MKAFLVLQRDKKRKVYYDFVESEGITSGQDFLDLLTLSAGDVVKVLSWRGKLVSLCML